MSDLGDLMMAQADRIRSGRCPIPSVCDGLLTNRHDGFAWCDTCGRGWRIEVTPDSPLLSIVCRVPPTTEQQ